MAAANARVGLAKSAFFPQLNITGAAGFESATLGDLFMWSSRAFLLGPLAGTALTLPLFDGGRRKAQVRGAEAQFDQAAADYRQTVLGAFQSVEDQLALNNRLAEESDEAARAARRALSLALGPAGEAQAAEKIAAGAHIAGDDFLCAIAS